MVLFGNMNNAIIQKIQSPLEQIILEGVGGLKLIGI